MGPVTICLILNGLLAFSPVKPLHHYVFVGRQREFPKLVR
jgi:hypothetical protein